MIEWILGLASSCTKHIIYFLHYKSFHLEPFLSLHKSQPESGNFLSITFSYNVCVHLEHYDSPWLFGIGDDSINPLDSPCFISTADGKASKQK